MSGISGGARPPIRIGVGRSTAAAAADSAGGKGPSPTTASAAPPPTATATAPVPIPAKQGSSAPIPIARTGTSAGSSSLGSSVGTSFGSFGSSLAGTSFPARERGSSTSSTLSVSAGGGSAGGAPRAVAKLRVTRASTAPELRRPHYFVDVVDHAPARGRRGCAVCAEPVDWPREPAYLLCRRCLRPVHTSCHAEGAAVAALDCPDEPGATAAVAPPVAVVVENVAAALADKVARLDALDSSLAALQRDRRMSAAGAGRDEDRERRQQEERRLDLTRERADLLNGVLVGASEISPEATRTWKVDEKPSFKDRMLSALS